MGSMLEEIDDGLWVRSVHNSFMGLHLGTRMTVVRLASGGLWIHSPVPLDDQLQAEVDELGQVEHIVCPNSFHHLSAGQWAEHYRRALLHGPAQLKSKRKDLNLDAELGSGSDFGGELVPFSIPGTLLHETVFVHPATRTLISSDLVENFKTSSHLPTRLYLKASGIHGCVGWSKPLRTAYVQRGRARDAIEGILTQDFERVILAHGNVIESNGPALVRGGLGWLLK